MKYLGHIGLFVALSVLVGCGATGKNKIVFTDDKGNPVVIEQEFVAPEEKKEDK
jgi:major membrane immunogen (membrane-anchored lipoprotein)